MSAIAYPGYGNMSYVQLPVMQQPRYNMRWSNASSTRKRQRTTARRVRAAATRTLTKLKEKEKGTRSKPVHTTIGKRSKFAKRKRVVGAGKYLRHGSYKKLERGGTLQSASDGVDKGCVYFAHSCFARDEIADAVARALVRRLCIMAELDFTSWNTRLHSQSDEYSIGFQSYLDVADGTLDTSALIFVNSTSNYSSLADVCRAALVEVINNGEETPEFVNVVLYRRRPNNELIKLALMNLKNVKLDLCSSSRFVVQNRTAAAGLPDGQEENVNDIQANPLVGRRYLCTGSAPLQKSDVPSRDASILTPDGDSWYKEFTPTNSLATTRWTKPPAANFFKNCIKSNYIRLSPGEIKSSKIDYNKTMSFFMFIRLMKDALKRKKEQSIVPVRISGLGNTEVIGFEKMIDSRTGEPLVTVGYEANYSIGCIAWYKKTQSAVELIEVA
jgi:hypothetical protein